MYWKKVHTQPKDRKHSDRIVKLTSKTVSSQKVRPEATSVSLPAFAGVGQEGRGNRRKPEKSYLSAFYKPDPLSSQPKKKKKVKIVFKLSQHLGNFLGKKWKLCS